MLYLYRPGFSIIYRLQISFILFSYRLICLFRQCTLALRKKRKYYMKTHRSFFQVCAVGAIAAISGLLPIPLALKGIIVCASLIALLLIKPEKEE